MRTAINFDDQSRAMAKKVGDVRPERRLSSKMSAAERKLAQLSPKRSLRFGHFTSQFARGDNSAFGFEMRF